MSQNESFLGGRIGKGVGLEGEDGGDWLGDWDGEMTGRGEDEERMGRVRVDGGYGVLYSWELGVSHKVKAGIGLQCDSLGKH